MNKSIRFSITFGLFCAASAFAQDSLVTDKNALLQDIQFDTFYTDIPNEYKIKCWINFFKAPSTYYYEVKRKEKLLLFVFNNSKADSTLAPSILPVPITKITIINNKIDTSIYKKNKKPEMADQVKILLNFSTTPRLEVTDKITNGDGSIFVTYKWTSNEKDIHKYELHSSKAWIWITLGILLTVLSVKATTVCPFPK